MVSRKGYGWLVATAALVCALGGAGVADLDQGVREFRNGQLAQAIETLGAEVEKDGTNLAALYWLGRAQLDAGQEQAATKAFGAVIEHRPNSIEARYWLGIAHLRQGQDAEARAQFEAALRVDPGHGPSQAALKGVGGAAELAPPAAQIGIGGLPGGSRIAIDSGGLPLDMGSVDLLSSSVYDYTFSGAPTDWVSMGGLWAVTNRWTCQPQWSWYGGHAGDGIAALWNKREFVGDVTVEAYFAFKMGLATTGSYKNPNDLNITIHGDGANPSSGYCFMIGAGRNAESRIMKGTEVLASSADVEGLLPIFEDGYPSSYEFHRKWWSVRARQHGSKLQLYLDEHLAVEAEDPDPLRMGRVALWTYDNGMLISRVKVYREGETMERMPAPGLEQIKAPLTEVAETPFSISSSTHPSAQNDFEGDVGDWSPRSDEDPVCLRIVEPGVGGAGHCLSLTNTVSGGTFGATIIPGQFDLKQLPQLSFDYRLPADGRVKASFYLTMTGRLYEVVFCGPSHGASRARQMGAIEGVRADGEWHHAQFDLLAAAGRLGASLKSTKARDLWVGNLCEDGYLLAGFGGNQLGATYQLDNVVLDKPGQREIKLAISSLEDAGITGYSLTADTDPLGEAPEFVSTTEPSVDMTTDTDGVWYVHVRAQLEEERWSRTVHYRVRVDETAPEIAQITPAPGSVLADGPVRVKLQDPGGSGIDWRSAEITVNGNKAAFDGLVASFAPGPGTLDVDPRLLVPEPKDGDTVELCLAPLKDGAGNQMAEGKTWSYRISFADDHTPPPPPKLTVGSDGYLCNEDFEHGVGDFSGYGGSGGAEVSVDTSTAASGGASLRVYNRTSGGRFGIYVRKRPFDAGKHRFVSFDYKIPARLRADLALYVNGDWKAIHFKDTDNNLGYIGKIPDVQDDNQWHHAELNLYELLRKDDPSAGSYVVRQFVIADWNWTANAQGQTYHLDNFQIAPVVSAAKGLTMSWRAPDISGILGLGFAFREDETTEVAREIRLPGSKGILEGIDGGDGRLHARVCDGAGNWSDTASFRFAVDCDAPRAEAAGPLAGAKVASSTVTLKVADAGAAGIDPASVVLAIAGKDYKLQDRCLSYDSESEELVWNCEGVSPQPVVLPDGQAVTVRLKSAGDYAGNPATNLPEWSWTMDYAQDHTAPEVAKLHSTTHPTFLTHTFESGLEGWACRGGDAGARVELDTSTAGSGKACVKLTQKQANGAMSAFITTETFTAEKYPHVSFRYKVPDGVTLDLIAQLSDGKEYAIAFTDNPTGAVGKIPGVKADGEWHHATVDIQVLLRQKQQRGSLQVTRLSFADRNKKSNPAGAEAWFDDFIIGKVGTSAPVIRWRATDTTGIKGYSYALDQDPGTAPDETIEGSGKSHRNFGRIGKGRWYFHIRAVDGAGNWGPTRHYALMHLTAE